MEQLLVTLIKFDAFCNAGSMVEGIAKRAIDEGYETLSVKQKAVLTPFLSKMCSGSTDPGGYHNGCEKMLSDGDLVEAYELSEGGELQCEDCRSEDASYEHEWEKFSRD